MSQNHDSPTPEEKEAMRRAAAFAYGYSFTMFGAKADSHYFGQVKRLEEDLELFGCFFPHSKVPKTPYMQSVADGVAKAVEELEAKRK